MFIDVITKFESLIGKKFPCDFIKFCQSESEVDFNNVSFVLDDIEFTISEKFEFPTEFPEKIQRSVPLADCGIIEGYRILSMYDGVLDMHQVAFASDWGGSIYFIDLRSDMYGKVGLYDHLTGNIVSIADSFSQFLEMLAPQA